MSEDHYHSKGILIVESEGVLFINDAQFAPIAEEEFNFAVVAVLLLHGCCLPEEDLGVLASTDYPPMGSEGEAPNIVLVDGCLPQARVTLQGPPPYAKGIELTPRRDKGLPLDQQVSGVALRLGGEGSQQGGVLSLQTPHLYKGVITPRSKQELTIPSEGTNQTLVSLKLPLLKTLLIHDVAFPRAKVKTTENTHHTTYGGLHFFVAQEGSHFNLTWYICTKFLQLSLYCPYTPLPLPHIHQVLLLIYQGLLKAFKGLQGGILLYLLEVALTCYPQ